MLRLFLYCSYSGSAAGYQKAVVDAAEKTVRKDRGGEIPEPVSYIWTHGGARAAAGWSRGSGYFLVKKIAYLNEGKQRDEQGRKVFMNCALAGEDRQELEYAANGFLACYKAASRGLGELLVMDESDIGYTIRDFAGLAAWFEQCIHAGRAAQPRVRVSERPISFIVLEADWEYFIGQCRAASLRGAACPPNPMSDEVYTKLLERSLEEFPAPPAPPAPAAEAQEGAAVPAEEKPAVPEEEPDPKEAPAEEEKPPEAPPAETPVEASVKTPEDDPPEQPDETPAEPEEKSSVPARPETPKPPAPAPRIPEPPKGPPPPAAEPKREGPVVVPSAVGGKRRQKISLLPILLAAIIIVLLIQHFTK